MLAPTWDQLQYYNPLGVPPSLLCFVFLVRHSYLCICCFASGVLSLMSLQEAAGASTIFVDVLWAMVVLVGCSMSLGGCMVAYRHFKAGGGGAPMYLPVQGAVSTLTCTYICMYLYYLVCIYVAFTFLFILRFHATAKKPCFI